MHSWWTTDANQIYWMEITDRSDLGADLNAPQRDDSDNEHWGYSLVREVRDRDVVLHYHKKQKAIVAWSLAGGSVWEDEVVWGAHGTVARTHGVEPYKRPGWRLALTDFTPLSSAIKIEELRSVQGSIGAVRAQLAVGFGEPLYFPFALSAKRPLRATQTYLTKFPAQLAGLFPNLLKALETAHLLREMAMQEPAPTTTVSAGPISTASQGGPGVAYQEADEDAKTSKRDPFAVDPALVERGLRGHARTQNALAKLVKDRGLVPRSPLGDPNFDLAWEVDGKLFVAEIKSMTNSNQEKQLRLGLGQVLRYQQMLGSPDKDVAAVLAVEKQPSDPGWIELCSTLGVLLVWPETFETILEEVPNVRRIRP